MKSNIIRVIVIVAVCLVTFCSLVPLMKWRREAEQQHNEEQRKRNYTEGYMDGKADGYNYFKDPQEIQTLLISAGIYEVEIGGKTVPMLMRDEWGPEVIAGLEIIINKQRAERATKQF